MPNRKTLNLLIPSAGGLTGTYLVQHFLKGGLDGCAYRIVAADSSDHVFVKYRAHQFYRVPKSGDSDYENVIFSIVEKENINMIFPTTSYEMPFYCRNKEQFRKRGVQLLICDWSVHRILHHKKKMYRLLQRFGLPVPEIYEDLEKTKFPAMIKSCESSGSKGVQKLEDRADWDYWTAKWTNFVVTEFIGGSEYTVDCLFDREGNLLVCNPRERIKTMGGGVVICKNTHFPDIREWMQNLSNHIPLEGPVNFQFICDRDGGRKVITDFNPRFASGGLALTVASGYDIPNMMVRLMLGQPVEKQMMHQTLGAGDLTMYRYFQEYFVAEK